MIDPITIGMLSSISVELTINLFFILPEEVP